MDFRIRAGAFAAAIIVAFLPGSVWALGDAPSECPCPKPSQIVKYSDDFYRALRFYAERDPRLAAVRDLQVSGVILGGGPDTRDWSKESVKLSDTEARSIVDKETQLAAGQLEADALAAMCRVGCGANSFERLAAVDAIREIAAPAFRKSLGFDTLSHTHTVEVVPAAQTVIFERSSPNAVRTVSYFVHNTGPTDIEVVSSQDGMSPPVLANQPLLPLGPTRFKLGPDQKLRMDFKVQPPSATTYDYVSDTLSVWLVNAATYKSNFVIIRAWDDVTMRPPTIDPGELQTNARIRCECTHMPVFTDQHIVWTPLDPSAPYHAGPNMGYCEETSAKAITTGTFAMASTAGSMDRVAASLKLEHVFGGTCGPGGTQLGGDAWIAPQYQTVVHLPRPFGTRKWTLTVRCRSSATECASWPDTSAPLAPVRVAVSLGGVPLGTILASRNAPDSSTLTLTGLTGGDYRIELACPTLVRGCHGAPAGTQAYGKSGANLEMTAELVAGP